MDRLLSDLRYALRSATSSVGTTSAIVTTLALVIGANVAFFSVLNALVFRSLPVRSPESLVQLSATDTSGRQNRSIYYSTYRELARLPAFSELFLYTGGGILQVESNGTRHEGIIEAFTPGLLESLGLQPHLGRFFATSDSPDDQHATPVVVLSYQFWRSAFGEDPSILGKEIRISGTPATVIGVTPPDYRGFYVDAGFAFSVPLTFLNRQIGSDPKRPVRGLNAVGRLARGVSLEEARAMVKIAWISVRSQYAPTELSPQDRADLATHDITLKTLSTGFSSMRDTYGEAAWMVWSLTSILFLVGCVNLGGLYLQRAADRERDVAIRAALGASRARLSSEVLAEVSLLSLMGTVLSVPLAILLTRAAERALQPPGDASVNIPLTPDVRVFVLATALGALASAVIALFPLWRMRRSLEPALRSARTLGATSGRVSKWLLVAQVALTVLLMVGSTLLLSSLQRLRTVEAGFESPHVRWSRLFAIPNGYRAIQEAVYYPELVRQISLVPGVTSAALCSYFPSFFGLERLLPVQRVSPANNAIDGVAASATVESITPGFFDVLRIPVTAGRDFTWADDTAHPPVAIINSSLSRALFGERSAIGEQIRVAPGQQTDMLEVVGIVPDAAVANYRDVHAPVVFRARMQQPRLARAPVLLLRTKNDEVAVEVAASAVIDQLGHEYPRRFSTLTRQIEDGMRRERLLASLATFLAFIALILTMVGVYSVLAHVVARRRREIGLRVALGESPGAVLWRVIRDGAAVVAIGLAVGVPVAAAFAGALRPFLFAMDAWTPTAYVQASAVMMLVGCLAGLWPGMKASRVDPVIALREDNWS